MTPGPYPQPNAICDWVSFVLHRKNEQGVLKFDRPMVSNALDRPFLDSIAAIESAGLAEQPTAAGTAEPEIDLLSTDSWRGWRG